MNNYPVWMFEHAMTFVKVCELHGHRVIPSELADALSGDDNGSASLRYYLEFAYQFLGL